MIEELVSVFGFYLTSLLVGCTLLPRFARLGFFLTFPAFFFPASFSLSSQILATKSFSTSILGAALIFPSQISISRLIDALLRGMFGGVAVSLAAYSALAIGAWLVTFTGLRSSTTPFNKTWLDTQAYHNGIFLLIILLFNLLIFSPGVASNIFAAFPIIQDLVLQIGLAGSTAVVGQLALLMGLTIIFPLMFASFTADLVLILFERYCSSIASEGVLVAIKLPFLILCLSVLLYSFTTGFGQLISETLPGGTIFQQFFS